MLYRFKVCVFTVEGFSGTLKQKNALAIMTSRELDTATVSLSSTSLPQSSRIALKSSCRTNVRRTSSMRRSQFQRRSKSTVSPEGRIRIPTQLSDEAAKSSQNEEVADEKKKGTNRKYLKSLSMQVGLSL